MEQKGLGVELILFPRHIVKIAFLTAIDKAFGKGLERIPYFSDSLGFAGADGLVICRFAYLGKQCCKLLDNL